MKECRCDKCSHELCAKKVPIFSFLSQEELRKIVDMTGHKEFKKGEILCSEGEKSNSLFIINEGTVKLSKITRDGKEQIVRILTSGDFFGELNLFNAESTNNFTAYAISPVKICTLIKADMDEILVKNPEISIKILKEVTRRLAETENLAQSLATNDSEVRAAYIILELGEKYGRLEDGTTKIELPLSREEMANYAGITRETLSRKLSKFEDLGLISQIGNKIIAITDEDGLREYI